MKVKVKAIWQDIPELDAQIRTIEEPYKNFNQWTVEIGLFESLGEIGGMILTEFFDKEPTIEQIKVAVTDYLKSAKTEMNERGLWEGMEKFNTEEKQEKVIDKILKGGIK